MAPSCLDKQTASCKLPHDWLATLVIDLATFCDMWSSKNCTVIVFHSNEPIHQKKVLDDNYNPLDDNCPLVVIIQLE